MTSQNRLTPFSRDLLIAAGLSLLLAIAFALYVSAEQRVDRANEIRQRSYLLADELRQSSDDLTRMARTYVGTGDASYKQHFQDIVDIRNGKKPRPENYWRPYWDLMPAGASPPRPDSAQAIPLLDLMRQAGFTEAEFRKLAEAKANSDVLVVREFAAMKMVETGKSQAVANRPRAVNMLFDATYLQGKAAVMKPIDDFLGLVDGRTLAAVQSAYTHAKVLRAAFIAVGLGLMFMLWHSYTALRQTLGGSLDEVESQIIKIGSGDFSTAINPKQGQENSVLGWLSVTGARLRDSEANLAQTRRRYELILNSVGEGIHVFDGHGKITFENPAAVAMLGWDAEELLGLPAHETIHHTRPNGTVYPKSECPIYATLQDGVVRRVDNEVFWRQDGTGFPVEYSSTRLDNEQGETEGVVVSFRDIAERKRAEEALLRSEERYRSLTLATTQIVWTTPPDGAVKDMPSWRDFSGQSIEEVQGWGWTQAVHPDDREQTAKIWANCVETHSLYETEFRIRRADGIYRFFAVRGVPVLESDGSLREWVGTCTDITDLKRYEENLKAYAAKLEANNRELQDFAYVASHDLQEPLRKIQAFGDRLKSRHADALGDTGRDYLERMQNAASRMQTLINDLLALSRVTSKAQPFVTVDLNAVAREVLSDLETRIERTEGQVLLGELPSIQADPVQMRQLLQNLIGNALKFHRPEVAPVVKVSSQILAGDKQHRDGKCCLLVEDNGIGFEEQYLDRVFIPFQRLHGRADYEGTGIGLAICRKITERHQGDITARSVPGQGTTFVVTLPLKARQGEV